MEEPEACEACQISDNTIDHCYDALLQLLTNQGRIKEVSARLQSFSTYHDRVLYVYAIMKELAYLPIVKTNPKNNQVAVYYRNQGNKFYSQKKHYEAWQSYNLSLLYAVGSSEHFIYAVSNRSAVFFTMGKYEESLRDINFVLSMEYPEKLRAKLIDRKNKCLSVIEAAKANIKKDPYDSKIAEILTIKGPKHEKYVCASAKLNVVYTKEMGRHVIANEDIQVGEVIAQENPYLTVLLLSQFMFCCAYCLSRNMNLYPCLNCTYTLYCSVECRENAYSAYHMVECGLLPSIISMQFTKLEWLALRALIRSRTDQVDWYDMFDVAEAADERVNTDAWGCVKVDGKWVFDSKYYASIHTLETNFAKRKMPDIFRKCISAAAVTHFLSVLHFLKSDNVILGEKAKRYVTDTLFRHMMTAPTNMHSICANIENEDGDCVNDCNIACGAYAFHSMLNHSCTPNVVRYVKLGTAEMSLVAIRPIKKGMQIFDNYGLHHALLDRQSRRDQLSTQYKFNCACEACIDDWPTHLELKEAQGIPATLLLKKKKYLSIETLRKLLKGDKATAVESYEPLCQLIEELDRYAPCKELGECQEALKQCLVIFQGVIPHGYTKEVKWSAFPPCASIGGPPHIGRYISGPAL